MQVSILVVSFIIAVVLVDVVYKLFMKMIGVNWMLISIKKKLIAIFIVTLLVCGLILNLTGYSTIENTETVNNSITESSSNDGTVESESNTDNSYNESQVQEDGVGEDNYSNENQTASVTYASPISNEHIINCYASSELVESDYNIVDGASNVLDGKSDTIWCEGVTGSGIEEYITFVFDGEYDVSTIEILNGFQKDENLYYNNSRPSKIEASFSDGSSEIINLDDTVGWQSFDFEYVHKASDMTLTIKDVYPGNKYEDTCISDVVLN